MSEERGAGAAPAGLDRDQTRLLQRRFHAAVAALAATTSGPGAAGRAARHELERDWRIATNMRGHMR